MREKEISNNILQLFEAGLDIAIFTPLRLSFDEASMDAADIMTDNWVTKILTNDTMRADGWEAFLQQTRLGWTRIFMEFLPLAGEPPQQTWNTGGWLHAHDSSLSGDVPAGHTTIAFFTALPNNDTSKNNRDYKQKQGYG